MNCLKISRNLILVFTLVFLPGCVSVPEALPEVYAAENPDELPVPVSPVGKNVPRDNARVDSVKWIAVEPEKISPVILLPVVSVRKKLVASNLPSDYSGFYNIHLRISDRELSPDQWSVQMPEQLAAAVSNSGTKSVPVHEAARNLSNEPVQTVPVSEKNDVVEEDKPGSDAAEQEIKVFLSDKVKITLEGRGWIYLPDNKNISLNYSGREFTDGNTIYSFKPGEEGNFTLNFQFQDLIKNIYTKEKVHLIVYSKLSESDSKAAPLDVSVEKSEISVPVDLNLLLKEYLSTKNIEEIFNMVPELVKSTDPEVRSLLPETSELLYRSSRFVPTILILETLFMDKNYRASKDRLLYLLGKSYEADSPVRNELIAAAYYKQLLDTYPSSIYWNESHDRYRFLKRRYIDIR